jgi:hypothetical protein
MDGMMAIILIGAGAIAYVVATVLLFKDCYRDYGSTMGGEMLAGALWAFGSLLLAAGICLFKEVSMIWAAPSAVALYLSGMPYRRAVTWFGSKYGKSSPTRPYSGFAEHTKRTKAARKGR